MLQSDQTVRPQPDDMFFVFPLLAPSFLAARQANKPVTCVGEFMSGKALIAYAVESLRLSQDATVYEIAQAMPKDVTFLLLTNPCAPRE